MSYVVLWRVSVIAALQQLEASADDPARIRTAAKQIDATLRQTPTDVGESRENLDRRLWYSEVLGVYFRVHREDGLVEVLAVGPAVRH